MSRWEIEDEDWDRVRETLRQKIEETARRQGLIAYSDLVRDVPEIDGPRSHALAEMLGEIGAACHAESLPLLTALVVYKDPSSRRPGPGFFEAAAGLGLDVGSNAAAREGFWSQQVTRCYEVWAR